MPPNKVLVDSSYLYAFFDENNPQHAAAVEVAKIFRMSVREILLQYQDARLDFVDCCIMALSERFNITQVCTFDRRDFGIFRPRHVDYLELLP
jgi:predicted nucleic acid-binding protein